MSNYESNFAQALLLAAVVLTAVLLIVGVQQGSVTAEYDFYSATYLPLKEAIGF